MSSRLKILVATLCIGACLFGVVGGYLLGQGEDVVSESSAIDDFETNDELVDEDFTDSDGFIYEFAAESAEECTSVETFDESNSVCFFECDTDNDCDQLLEQAEQELDESLTEYAEGSADRSENVPDADDAQSIADYDVTTGEELTLASGEESENHQGIWDQVSAISPNQISDSYIETFRIFSNDEDNTVAYVVDFDEDGKFILAINLAEYESSSAREQTLTIVHELAHIVTLNQDQAATGTCSYEALEGCFGDESLLAGFVDKFWTKTDLEKAENQEDLYSGNEDNFVTEYAASNAEEDIAESFAYYTVRSNYDADDIASQKQAFFDDFAAAKEIKNQMRKTILRQFVRERAAN